MSLKKFKILLTRWKTDLQVRKKSIEITKHEISKASELAEKIDLRLEVFSEVSEMLQRFSNEARNHAKNKIIGVVSYALKVFGPEYSFDIEYTTWGSRVGVDFYVIKDGVRIDPFDCGGGIIDVVAFSLRVSTLLAKRPEDRKLILLDEPFKFVSESYRGMMVTFLEKLAVEMGIQFVVVTHLPELIKPSKVTSVIRLS